MNEATDFNQSPKGNKNLFLRFIHTVLWELRDYNCLETELVSDQSMGHMTNIVVTTETYPPVKNRKSKKRDFNMELSFR